MNDLGSEEFVYWLWGYNLSDDGKIDEVGSLPGGMSIFGVYGLDLHDNSLCILVPRGLHLEEFREVDQCLALLGRYPYLRRRQ